MFKTPKTTIIIQARMGSKRFPKKVLARIEKKPMIWHVINRVKQIKGIQIILATSKKEEDDVLIEIAKKCNILNFRGNSDDVLRRFYNCAIRFDADPIIRITGDSPLIDPRLIRKLLKIYISHNYDYVSNVFPIRTFPDGLDIEIFSFQTLKKMKKAAKLKSEREHVTSYIRNNIQKFKIYNYTTKKNLSWHRWTIDEKEDLIFVKKIYSYFKPKLIFSTTNILKIISQKPQLKQINYHIPTNEGYVESLKQESKTN